MFRKISLIVALAMALSVTSCGAFRRQQHEEDTLTTNIVSYSDMKELQSGQYYVLHNGKYQELYLGDASFDKTKVAGTWDKQRTCWFQKDFAKIPTLYKGDSLIYCNDDYVEEKFIFERFEYVGYTIGICNLEERDSGRYSLNAHIDNKGKTRMQIAVNSDANKLYELDNDTVVIQSIGGSDLKAGNVSRGGTIKGLKENGKYKCQIYVGTQLYDYSLIADSIALTSMESYTSMNYKFLESRLARIEIPEWFNTGYYMINGMGLFRYVNDTAYTEYTDFNVPNAEPDKNADSESNTESAPPAESTITEAQNDTKSKRFTLENERKIIARVTWTETDSAVIKPAPTAKIIGDTAAYSLNRVEGENVLTLVKTLPAGTYRIVVEGLDGRSYEVTVE